MRRPTPVAKIYAWHRAAIAGMRPATHEEEVQCGWFRTRLVRNGPWVPARIWLHREIDIATGELTCDEVHRGEIDGREYDALYVWSRVSGKPISKAQWEALRETQVAIPEMAATHATIAPRGAIRP